MVAFATYRWHLVNPDQKELKDIQYETDRSKNQHKGNIKMFEEKRTSATGRSDNHEYAVQDLENRNELQDVMDEPTKENVPVTEYSKCRGKLRSRIRR